MTLHWKLDNNLLCLYNRDFISTPSADIIFEAEFKNLTKVDDGDINKPSLDLPEMKFSKFAYDIKIRLNISDNGIQLTPIIYFEENKYQISISELLLDYIIINNNWLPYIPDKNIEINNALNELNIQTTNITVKQALELKKIAFLQDFLVEDEVTKEKLLLDPYLSSPFFFATLYEYQLQGFGWMNFMTTQELGIVLADEMGLGKTIQIIRLVCNRIEEGHDSILIVAPSSLLENWKREFEKFTKNISILIHRGASRTGLPNFLKAHHVIITSYELLNLDFFLFKMIEWDLVVADEAQTIKNPIAQRTKSIKAISKKLSIAVTGTPFENNIKDVWSIIDFVFPEYLGDLISFEKRYINSLTGAKKLEPLISPLILRRKVIEVAQDLPEKIIIEQAIEMDEQLFDEYDNLRLSALNNVSGSQGLANIIKLRMFCCDPGLIEDIKSKNYQNYKLERLLEIIEEVTVLKEKIIVFTSFQKMADILKNQIQALYNFYCEIIDGRTAIERRQIIIDEFSTFIGSAILVLNPKAAGTGLNITAANHVIHYNSEWNPATEDQASARAYRRGQDKPVRIYKLFYSDTIEESIQARLNIKRELSETAIVGVNGDQINIQEMVKALNYSPKNFKNEN